MIPTDFFYRNHKINYPQAVLQECKYKVIDKTTNKKNQNWRFTDFESDSDFNSDSEINKMKLIMKLNDLLINLD